MYCNGSTILAAKEQECVDVCIKRNGGEKIIYQLPYLSGTYCEYGKAVSCDELVKNDRSNIYGYSSRICGGRCQAGTWQNSYNRDNRCTDCPEGHYCPLSGIVIFIIIIDTEWDTITCDDENYYCPKGSKEPIKV